MMGLPFWIVSASLMVMGVIAFVLSVDRDNWRRKAIIEHRKVVYLSGILHQKDIRTREYGFINPHWTNAAADVVKEATDER